MIFAFLAFASPALARLAPAAPLVVMGVGA